MNFKNYALFALVLASAVGCGTSQAPVVGLGNGYNGGYNNGYNNYNNGYNNGYNNYGVYSLPGGGTKQVVGGTGYTAYAGSNKVLQYSAQVNAGDSIEVNASQASVMAQGLFGATNAIFLNSLSVTVGSQSCTTGLSGKCTASSSGALSASFSASGLTGLFGNNAMYSLSFPYGGILIYRCKDASGQAMNCP